MRQIHARERPAVPLTVPVGALDLLAGAPRHECVGLGGGTVIGSFAFGLGPLAVYGMQEDGTATVVGVAVGRGTVGAPVAAGLAGFAHDHDLLLVDWCRCVAASPDSISDLLRTA